MSALNDIRVVLLLTVCGALAGGACSEFPVRPVEVTVNEDTDGGRDVSLDLVADPGAESDLPSDLGGDLNVEPDLADVGEDVDATVELCNRDDDCDDGRFCNGVERCAPNQDDADARGCVPGEPVDVDDGIDCTADGCDEAGDQILHDPSGCPCLAPGLACDCDGNPGACPEVGQCHRVVCSEALTCVALALAPGASCDDGFGCTGEDVCDGAGQCSGAPADSRCADPLFCNGRETCSPTAPNADANGCLPGAPPNLDDGLDCTVDTCNEDTDQVEHVGQGCQPCETDEECVPEVGVPCFAYVCADGVCAAEVADGGAPCDDGLNCTVGDVCDDLGVCLGVRTDSVCNDGRWCNGVETCVPEADDADEAGCIPSIPPSIPDGVECTTDVCVECDHEDCTLGLEGSFVYEPTEACECSSPEQCASELCLVPLCDLGTYTCTSRLAEPNTPCEDPDGCLEGGLCDGRGECVGGENICECEGPNDCPVSDCAPTAQCQDGQCIPQYADDRTACDVEGCPGGSEGQCWSGVCELHPEGRSSDSVCFDEIDNDCDGLVDGLEANCLTPRQITATGPVTPQPVGLDAETEAIEVTTAGENGPYGDQSGAVFCVAHMLEYEQEFDFGEIHIDPFVTVLDGAIPGEEIAHAQQGQDVGVRLCEGKGMELGPFTFPAVEDGLTLMIEVDTIDDQDDPLQPGEHLIVAHRSERLPGGQFVTLVAVGNDDGLTAGRRRHRFIVDNIAGSDLLTLRLQPEVEFLTSCAFVDAVRIFSLPRLAPAGDDPTQREYVSWLTGEDDLGPAYQGYEEEGSEDQFATVFGSVDADRQNGDAFLGGWGLDWSVRGGTDYALFLMPLLYPSENATPNRSNPLVVDVSTGTDEANYESDREIFHQTMSNWVAGRHTVLASSVHTQDLPYLRQHLQLPDPDRESFRTLAVVPEEGKALFFFALGMYQWAEDIHADALLDEVHMYWFTSPTETDISVETLGTQMHDAGAHLVRVRSRRPGRVLVRCYWQKRQLFEQPAGPTLTSNDLYVTFE